MRVVVLGSEGAGEEAVVGLCLLMLGWWRTVGCSSSESTIQQTGHGNPQLRVPSLAAQDGRKVFRGDAQQIRLHCD